MTNAVSIDSEVRPRRPRRREADSNAASTVAAITAPSATRTSARFSLPGEPSGHRNDVTEMADEDPVRIPIEAEIDLHAFLARDSASVVEEYIIAAADAGLREVRVVHGRGRGVQRAIVQAVLERHPLVEDFWDDPRAHLGATIVRLRTADGR